MLRLRLQLAIALLLMSATSGLALAPPPLAAADGEETVTTRLQPGWNLAGWTEEEAGISAIFEAIPQLEAVYWWDAFRRKYTWAFRDESGPTGALTMLTPGMGLSLYVGGTETSSGTRPLNPKSGAATLRPGWNLVTWAGPDGTATDEALEVLGDIVVETQGVDGSAPRTLTTGGAFWLQVSVLKEWWQLDTPPIVIFGRGVPKYRRGFLTSEADKVVTYFGRELGLGVSELRIRFGHDRAECGEYASGTVFLSDVCLVSLAPEYVHALQEELAWRNQRGLPWESEPAWLTEGAAEYWSERYEAWRNYHSYESRLRHLVIPAARNTTAPLSRLWTYDALLAQKDGEALAHLAVDWLVNHAGEEALFNFYAQARPTTWTSRFKAVFGLSVSEFYELFEPYRAEVAPLIYRIDGTLVDASGKPLRGISVAIHSPDGEVVVGAGEPLESASFELEVPGGSHLLSFHVGPCRIGWYGPHGRIVSSWEDAEIVRSSVRGTNLHVRFTRLCSTIQGAIRNTDDFGVGGIQFEAFPETSRRSVATALSDEAGRFSLDVRRDGSFLLFLSQDEEPLGWWAGWRVMFGRLEITLTSDRQEARPIVVDRDDIGRVIWATGLQFLIPPPRIELTGTVYDPSGSPIQGVWVAAYSVDGQALAFGTTEIDGTFALETRAATYVVAVRVDTCGRRWYHSSEGTTPSRDDATAIDPAVDRTTGIEIRLGEPPVVGPCEP